MRWGASAFAYGTAGARRRMKPRLLNATLALGVTFCIGCANLYAADMAAASKSGDEVLVFLDPAFERQVGEDASLSAAGVLVERFGLGQPLRREKSGAIVFAVPSGMSASSAKQLADTIGRSRVALAARVTPSPTRGAPSKSSARLKSPPVTRTSQD